MDPHPPKKQSAVKKKKKSKRGEVKTMFLKSSDNRYELDTLCFEILVKTLTA